LDVLVISLPNRTDRQKVLASAMAKNGIDYQLFQAKDLSEFNQKYNSSRTVALYPIWWSHIQTMKHFLSGREEWVIVVEDDADFHQASAIDRRYIDDLRKTLPKLANKIDMFQIGFNQDSISGWKGWVLKSISILCRVSPQNVTSVMELSKKWGFFAYFRISRSLSPKNSFEFLIQGHSMRGTHAYGINRRFAEYLVSYFEENLGYDHLLPLDNFLYESTNTPTSEYNVVRFSNSLINQNNLPSDNLIQDFRPL
jgi:GR25 family glycosyltransferase involved in LPS biosynthesis